MLEQSGEKKEAFNHHRGLYEQNATFLLGYDAVGNFVIAEETIMQNQ